jgi:hypothetical protein
VFVYVKNVDCTKNCVPKSVLGVQSEGVGMPECACAGQERQEHRVRLLTVGVNSTRARVCIPSEVGPLLTLYVRVPNKVCREHRRVRIQEWSWSTVFPKASECQNVRVLVGGTRSTGCVCQQQVLTAPELECVSQASWSTSNIKLYVRVPKIFGSTRVCWIQSVSV